MGNAISIKDSKQYHETFAFRIMCNDCATKQKCILWRLHDEYKLYSSSLKYLKMCKECGDHEWFNWRVHVPTNVNLTCSGALRIHDHTYLAKRDFIIVIITVFISSFTYNNHNSFI